MRDGSCTAARARRQGRELVAGAFRAQGALLTEDWQGDPARVDLLEYQIRLIYRESPTRSSRSTQVTTGIIVVVMMTVPHVRKI